MTKAPSRFRRVQFRLRTLLVAVTLIAVGTAFFGTRWYRDLVRQQSIAAIEEAGGQVFRNAQDGIERIHFGGVEFGDEQLRNVAPYLRQFPELREIDFVRVSISDRGIESLAGLDQLKEVYLFETQVTEIGTKRLGKLLPGVAVKTESPDPVASGLVSANIYPHATVFTALLLILQAKPWLRLGKTVSGDGNCPMAPAGC